MTDKKLDQNVEPKNGVDLHLNEDQAEVIQDLLTNYDYAYRSDQEANCKRELVRKDKIGHYPYVAEAPDPSITEPAYDWTTRTWIERTQTVGQRVEDITKQMSTLNADFEKIKGDQTTMQSSQAEAVKVVQEVQKQNVTMANTLSSVTQSVNAMPQQVAMLTTQMGQMMQQLNNISGFIQSKESANNNDTESK